MDRLKGKSKNAPEESIGQRVLSPVLQPGLLNADRDVTLLSAITQQLLVSRDNQEVGVLLQLIIWWEVNCTGTGF